MGHLRERDPREANNLWMLSTSDSFMIDPSQISINDSENLVYMSLPILSKLRVGKDVLQGKNADLSSYIRVG